MKRWVIALSLFLAAFLRADQIVTTMDGRHASLKDDGTWKYLVEDPPVQIAHFKGSGSTDTEPFRVSSDEWLIGWTAEDFLMITVYSGSERAIAMGLGQYGQTVVHQSGIFYLGITASGAYEIWATELPGLK